MPRNLGQILDSTSSKVLTRARLEQVMKPLVDRTMEPVEPAAELYRSAGGQAPEAGAPPPSGTREGGGKEGVIDAEFQDTGT
jgi:hypothetical protein